MPPRYHFSLPGSDRDWMRGFAILLGMDGFEHMRNFGHFAVGHAAEDVAATELFPSSV